MPRRQDLHSPAHVQFGSRYTAVPLPNAPEAIAILPPIANDDR